MKRRKIGKAQKRRKRRKQNWWGQRHGYPGEGELLRDPSEEAGEVFSVFMLGSLLSAKHRSPGRSDHPTDPKSDAIISE